MNDAVQFKMITAQIGCITLNQPGKRNALTAQMWADLETLVNRAAKEDNLKVLVVTGAGAHFAAGADITEFADLYATPQSSADISAQIARAINALAAFPRPTIAKIRGACVGGGCAIALACDVRFADDTAQFAIPPAKLGLVYAFADIQRLIEAAGLSAAKDMLLSARKIGAAEAKDIGLINRLTGGPEADAAVHDYALSICKTSRRSNEVMKQMFSAYEAGQRGETEATRQMFAGGFTSDDFKEGYRAFLEKRAPDF